MSADPCSFSSGTRSTTRHLNLVLHVDFSRRVLRGSVQLTLEALEDRFSALVSGPGPGPGPGPVGTPSGLRRVSVVTLQTLDTKALQIFSVTANGQAAQFTMGPKHSFKGTPLDITLPFDLSRGQHVVVEVAYETSPEASALQWLSPEQTAGGERPYLFSQCQVINNQ
ncbi:Leukotriene A-4 hydrolase [Liparis tanakae]|uniref:Leukotriene A-4 hydrolase n=1 Tax=Liparis tanakae TaxID=230148 RepID=A0A4Z2EEZ8_9TELE|nr:Leukotriene A-4 hydrolase [Liparis tanakae]